ncbi:MAG: DUF4321 domain-containing protein [Bacillota bacterium]
MRHRQRSTLVLLVLLTILGWLGSYLGEMVESSLPFFGQRLTFGLHPTTVDLGFLALSFGLVFAINPMGMVGLLLAILIWTRI